MIGEAINAFELASGVSGNQMSFVIRSLLCAMFLLWAAWNIYGQFNLLQHHELDIHDLPLLILRVLLLCTLMVILVFIA